MSMLAIFLAELIGTLILVLLGNGSVANVLLKKSKGENGGWIIISAGWGFAVAMGVYIAGWVTGGHINPAVTLSMAVIGQTPWIAVPFYFLGQFTGAILGSFLVWLAYFPHWSLTPDGAAKLMCFCTKPQVRSDGANFLTEVIATAVLMLGVLGIFAPQADVGWGIAPYAVGILVFAIGLSLGGPTGYAINPARDLGPRIIHALLPIPDKGPTEWSYAYIPILGPFIGGILGALCFKAFIG
jgi:glycerol uptake facilitator